MMFAAILAFILLVIILAGMTAGIVRNLKGMFSRSSASLRLALAALLVLFSILLLRPHDDTFAALDNSGYRLMAKAFQAGRTMHESDRVLPDVPRDIRNAFMLLPSMDERNTRDRSFLIKSLDTCETEPFFYPLLPLCAMGLDALVPGDALDYLVPAIGLLFAAVVILVGAAYGGALGIMLAAALLIGSPLPAWLLRGFYVESVASVLLSLALMNWLTCPEGKRVSRFAYLALGLAVSFHPAMVVIALPLLMIFVLSQAERVRDVISGLVFFGAGLAVMVGMMIYACSPYGGLSFAALKFNFIASASHRVTLACAALMVFVTFIAVLSKPIWSGWYQKLSGRNRHIATCVPVILGVLPIVFAALLWSQKDFVYRGLGEAVSSVRACLGILLILSVGYILISRQAIRARMALMVVLLALPVFAYLKGAEQMGLWSQRRLLPVYLLLIVGILPAMAAWLQSRVQKSPKPLNMVALGTSIVVLLMAGGVNLCMWPAPYTVRCDRGAWDWVESVRTSIGNRLVFFDYYPFSVPFAVTGETRALGLNEKRNKDLPAIMNWLRERAGHEEVMLAAAYANPGLEDGVILRSVRRESVNLPRAHSKSSLPAVYKDRKIDVELASIVPATVADRDKLAVRKVFDKGPLALRGPWGRSDIPLRTTSGESLPAQWSRQGSGIIGPIPATGSEVRVEMVASSGCSNMGQELQIIPPWGGMPLVLSVSNHLTKVSGVIRVPERFSTNEMTGIYRIMAARPYNPGQYGIPGFDDDLGALIHSIEITIVGM